MSHQDPGTADLILLAIALCILLPLYFLPTLIAFGRRHYRRWQILAGNLLLGWTFFLWCYCLIVAVGPSGGEAD